MSAESDFIQGVWEIIPDESPEWVERVASRKGDQGPLGDYSTILRFMLDKGVPPEMIARFARIVGYETAFGLLCFAGDPGYLNQAVDFEYNWGIRVFDPQSERIIGSLEGVYESLLTADPSGREMRPPDDA